MNVTCPDCRSIFRVDPAKVPLGGVRARCSVCGGVISVAAPEFATAGATDAVARPAERFTPPPIAAVPDVIEASDAGLASDFEAMPEPAAAADLDEFVIEPPAPPRVSTPAAPTPRVSMPAVPTPRVSMPAVPTPRVSTPVVTPPRSPFTPPRAPFAAPRPTAVPPAPPPVQPPPVQPPRPSMIAPFAPPAVPPRPAAPAPPSTPPRPSALSPTPPVAPRVTQPRTITSQPFAPPVIPPQAPKPPVSTPAALPPRSTAPTPISATPSDGVARRAPNPFLANDPNQKGKRLARALVSDMVAYLPQKREEGLKNNTLKQLFREEIKKSYEEYVDQIGKEFAESTTHFQDALNDVLAGGKKIF